MTSNNEQQNVIQGILKEYLEGEDLDSAVSLWINQYSRQSLDKLSYFVFEIATTSTLRAIRKNILDDLERGLQEIPKVEIPIETIQAVSNVSQKVDADKEGFKASIATTIKEIEGLASFFEQMFSHLHNFKQVEQQQLLEEYLASSGLPKFVQRDFIKWFVYPHYIEGLAQNEADIRILINIVYSVMCEYIGPMKADRFMSQAVFAVENKFPMLAIKQLL